MGNIKPTYIKRVGEELLRVHPDRVTLDFNENKKLVNELTDVKYTGMRNKIAGYITRRQRQLTRQKV